MAAFLLEIHSAKIHKRINLSNDLPKYTLVFHSYDLPTFVTSADFNAVDLGANLKLKYTPYQAGLSAECYHCNTHARCSTNKNGIVFSQQL